MTENKCPTCGQWRGLCGDAFHNEHLATIEKWMHKAAKKIAARDFAESKEHIEARAQIIADAYAQYLAQIVAEPLPYSAEGLPNPSESRICAHCHYSIGIAQHGEFTGKYVHALTGNWLCALSAEPAEPWCAQSPTAEPMSYGESDRDILEALKSVVNYFWGTEPPILKEGDVQQLVESAIKKAKRAEIDSWEEMKRGDELREKEGKRPLWGDPGWWKKRSH